MNESVNNNLHNYIDDLDQIILKVIQTFTFCEYLFRPKDELNDYLNKSGFFQYSRYALFRVCIIDLYQLCVRKENNHFNLANFLNRISSDEKVEVNDEDLKRWGKSFKNKELIDKITNLRNKVYAHTDTNYKEIIGEIELTLDEVKSLIDDIVDMMNDIKSKAFEIDSRQFYKPYYKHESLENIIQNIIAQRALINQKKINDYIANTYKNKEL